MAGDDDDAVGRGATDAIADDVPGTGGRFLAVVGAAAVEAGTAEVPVVVAAGGAEAAAVAATADCSRISPSSTGDEDGQAAVAEEEEAGLNMTDRQIGAKGCPRWGGEDKSGCGGKLN